jgi:hypothetical protein
MQKKLELTAIIEKSEDGLYVGQVEELPGAISQGRTIDEVMENLTDAMDVRVLMHLPRAVCTKPREAAVRVRSRRSFCMMGI